MNNRTRSAISSWKQGGQGESVQYSGGTGCVDPSGASTLPKVLSEAMEVLEGVRAALSGFS